MKRILFILISLSVITVSGCETPARFRPGKGDSPDGRVEEKKEEPRKTAPDGGERDPGKGPETSSVSKNIQPNVQQQYRDVASIVVTKPPPPTDAFYFSEDFRLNTADEGELHFIKLKLSLGFEMGNTALSNELARRKPQLRNIINLILAGKTKAQLTSVSDLLELREEIKASINHLLSNGRIQEVYFNELIVN